jgi:hypothetical protein
MPEEISEADAKRTMALVVERFRSEASDVERYGPQLQEPGIQCSGWAIVWEDGAPEDWPSRAFGDGTITEPVGVFSEPVNHLTLGLYPA